MNNALNSPALQQYLNDAALHLGDAPANWVAPRADTQHDVLIVGGGQSGVTLAYALRRAGVHNVSVVEAASEDRTGSWRSKARMVTLRTPKTNLGPDQGNPSLTFRAWYEARHGRDAYEAIGRISTSDWSDYLLWHRQQTGIAVRFDTRVLRVDGDVDSGHLKITLLVDGVERVETARKVVLATGLVGGGEVNIPAALREALPREVLSHTDDPLDFSQFADRTIAVVGAASAAFDAAGSALEAGAREVHLFCRHADLAASSNMSTLSYPGAAENFFELPDDVRWRLANHFRARAPGPTPDTVRRATRFDNFFIHLQAADARFSFQDNAVQAHFDGAHLTFDHLIAGTGYRIDLAARPELRSLAPHATLWRDRAAVPETQRDSPVATYPYLGPGYRLEAKQAEWARVLHNVHCFNFAAIASYGRHVGDVGSLRYGIPRLVQQLVRDLFIDDLDHHLTRLTAAVLPELDAADYAASAAAGEARRHAQRPVR
ncbi:MAG: SidA/IucD/PvdA family monooxygenase [Janthinobacterium lividum]